MTLVKIDVDALDGVVRDLQAFHRSAIDQWTAVGNASSAALDHLPAMSTSLTTHLDALAGLTKDLRARIDLAVALNTGDDGHVPSGVLSVALPDDADAQMLRALLGRRLAELAGDVERMEDSRDLRRWVDGMLDTWGSDRVVMGSFYEDLGPDRLLDLMGGLAKQPYEEDIEVNLTLLDHLKDGLDTADEGWSDAERDAYTQGLVDSLKRPMDYRWGLEMHQALSYLMWDSHYSDEFLRNVAAQMDVYERVESAGVPGLWGRRDMGPDQWALYFPEGRYDASWDPMVSVMSALANNPQVSLDFFMGADDSAKVTYWLHDRVWSHDRFWELTDALVAATTTPSLLRDADSESAAQAATLASFTVNLLGHRPGIDADLIAGDDFHGHPDTAENLAKILSTYVIGMDSMVSFDEVGWEDSRTADVRFPYYGAEDVHNVPQFHAASLDAFIALATSSQAGTQVLRGGMDAYAQRKYAITFARLAADRDSAELIDMVRKSYQSQGSLEGVVANAVGDAAIARGVRADEAMKAWIALASDGVGLIPFGKALEGAGEVVVTVGDFALDRGRSAATDAVTEHIATAEDEARASSESAADLAHDKARYDFFSAAVEAGILDVDQLSPAMCDGDRLIPWEEFTALAGADQNTAISRIQSGLGPLFNNFDFDVVYKDAFRGYHEQ